MYAPNSHCFFRKLPNNFLAFVWQESVRAIGTVKMMFFMPLLQCAAIVAFLVPWVVYSVYTASMADVRLVKRCRIRLRYSITSKRL